MAEVMRYTSPTSLLSELQREVDRLFENFFGSWLRPEVESAVWTPTVDLLETDDAYLIYMDLPGVNRDQVTITFEDGTLQVSGERVQPEHRDAQYHRMERWYGRFFRSFNLGQNVNPDKIKAHFENGVLVIEAPKTEESKPVRIKIS
ncbi:Hsp20/alpha crystallin family protein [Rhodothermus marinus]|uniref:Hsp20/alpha crystallin family protein n=1 Tax=Rhodothermus marinus TaxID=29549 RepID=UPI0037C80E28